MTPGYAFRADTICAQLQIVVPSAEALASPRSGRPAGALFTNSNGEIRIRINDE